APRARVEPSVADDPDDTRYQFERNGYFWRDPADSRPNRLVFNRIVSLRDTWAARSAKGAEGERETAAEGGGSAVDGPDRGGGGAEPEAGAGAAGAPEPRSRISAERRAVRGADPELAARFERYREDHGLSEEDADVLTGSRALSDFYEAALEVHRAPDAVAAWIVNELRRELKERELDELPFGPADLGRLLALVDQGRVSRIAAKDVFAAMADEGGTPEGWIEELGLEKIGDADVLEARVREVLAQRPDKVREYRDGKTGLLGFFVGQVMQKTGGKADPKIVKGLLAERLEE
ncbi:MAG TPA: hypothetical protein VLL48_04145, partial [Longimicrobiales bacterium]|nr:hypothetical protein [Longimicrobiales bacterium]